MGADETEQGLRSILNLGHTFGHAIEALSGYGTYKHGEAVAIGMCLAARLSAAIGRCDPGVVERVKALVTSVGLPAEPPEFAVEEWIESMRLDKKVSSEAMRFVLIKRIGAVSLEEVGEEEIRALYAVL